LQKLTKSKEEEHREEAAREEAAREAGRVEYIFDDVLGCRRQGVQVQWQVHWEGGREAWGAKFKTWEPVDTTQVLELVGGVEELLGRQIQVLVVAATARFANCAIRCGGRTVTGMQR
jgi:hypothetical protein